MVKHQLPKLESRVRFPSPAFMLRREANPKGHEREARKLGKLSGSEWSEPTERGGEGRQTAKQFV